MNPLPIITHGRNGYRRGCRCEVCRKQYSEMRRAERTAFPLPKSKPERPPRTCKQKGCITQLSSYNPEDKCWTHQEPEPPHTIGQWAGPIANGRKQTLASVSASNFRSVEAAG